MRSLDDLTMYLYGFLDPSADEAMKDHLEECRACAELLKRLASEHRFFKRALARGYPDLPAWASDGESRHRRRF
jgi:anti-sigma factor RsiW